jgi:hypothetical protein
MDLGLKQRFLERWSRHFGDAELPLAFGYAAAGGGAEVVGHAKGHRCVFADLARARAGTALAFGSTSLGCAGGRRYFGFTDHVRADFAEFLSCGIPGRLEGERYKKSPELVHAYERNVPDFAAPAPFLVVKRWDLLEAADDPAAVVFFASGDVLSGLFTLANYAEAELDGVFCPFGAGCGALVKYPLLEAASDRPRAVLGCFDVSARPFVAGSDLSFAVPLAKFAGMVDDMDESFLGTKSWAAIRGRTT